MTPPAIAPVLEDELDLVLVEGEVTSFAQYALGHSVQVSGTVTWQLWPEGQVGQVGAESGHVVQEACLAKMTREASFSSVRLGANRRPSMMSMIWAASVVYVCRYRCSRDDRQRLQIRTGANVDSKSDIKTKDQAMRKDVVLS